MMGMPVIRPRTLSTDRPFMWLLALLAIAGAAVFLWWAKNEWAALAMLLIDGLALSLAGGNLFRSRANIALTVLTSTLLILGLFELVEFLFWVPSEADPTKNVFDPGERWRVIGVNRRILFVGRFPQGEEWRLWPPLFLGLGLLGLSFGLWARLGLREAVAVALAVAFVLGFLAHGENGALFAAAAATAVAAHAIGRRAGRSARSRDRARNLAAVGWALAMPFTVIIIVAFGGVKPALWGGLTLNVLLAVIGIGVGLPLGILLALLRASSLPVVKGVATAIIEITRGGPLIAWLFIARFVLPDFLPDALNTDVIVNATIIVCLFTAAYVAEIVRGGLQSVPHGQVEAAQSVGLSNFNITLFIVLPQALRAVIPALVSQLISLWKDTTLFSILGFIDALGAGQSAFGGQAEFIGKQKEVLLFIALLFWSVSFTMSRLSHRFERALGLGLR